MSINITLKLFILIFTFGSTLLHAQLNEKYFSSLLFVNEQDGYFIDKCNSIVKTTNSGNNWFSVYRSENSHSINNLYFLNQNIGFAILSSDYILKTTDAGNNWTKIKIPTKNLLTDICFANEDYGIVVGCNGFAYKTTNGGINWERKLVEENLCLFRIKIFDNNKIFILGSKGSVFSSSDEGYTWNNIECDSLGANMDICCLDKNNFIVVGEGGNILRSSDGGNKWVKLDKVTYNSLFCVKFFDEKHGIAVGEKGTILKTENAGMKWSPNYINKQNYRSIEFINKSVAILSGDNNFVSKIKYDNLSINKIEIPEYGFIGYKISKKISSLNAFLQNLIGKWEGYSEWNNNKIQISFSCSKSEDNDDKMVIWFNSKSSKGFLNIENDDGGKYKAGWFSPVIWENQITPFGQESSYEGNILYINKLKKEVKIGNNSKSIYYAKLYYRDENELIVEWSFNFNGIPTNSIDNKIVTINIKGKDIFKKILY